MAAPPFPIQGEKKQLNGGLYMYSQDIEPREDDQYMPSKVTLWNSSEDTQYRVTFTLADANCKALGDTKNEQPGVYQSLLYPGEAKELFLGSYASYKLSMQFGTPDQAWLNKKAEAESKDVNVEIDAVKALVRMLPSPDGKYTADYIASLCEAYQIPFVDLTFPPKTAPSIAREYEDAELGKKIFPWKRPYAYIKNPETSPCGLWMGDTSNGSGEHAVSPSDVGQGCLGNCYLIAGLAALAEDPNHILKMFNVARNPDLGIYRVVMCKNGWRHVVTVDDLFPTSNGKPAFASNKNELAEMWPAIMEKLYAKLYGSYASIAGGSPPHAMADFIGTPFVRFSDLPGWKEPGREKIFEFMEYADKRGALISLATPGVDTSDYAGGNNSASEKAMSEKYANVGLVSGHAFTILRVARYGRHRLVQIRNPWNSEREWNGKWGDSDTASWTPEAKKALSYKKADDGSFWMAFEDVFDWFDGGAANFVLDGWSCVRVAANFDNGVSDAVMRITVGGSAPVKLYMGVHQKDNRGLKPDEVQKYVAVLTAVVRQTPGSTRVEVLEQSGEAFMSARDVFMETELAPCDPSFPYYAVPMCYSDTDRSFVCSMWFSTHDNVTVEFMGFKEGFQNKRLMHPANFVPSQCSQKVSAKIQVETPAMGKSRWVDQEVHVVDWDDMPLVTPTPDQLRLYSDVRVAKQARERSIAAANGQSIQKVREVEQRVPYGTGGGERINGGSSSNRRTQTIITAAPTRNHQFGQTEASANFQPSPSIVPPPVSATNNNTNNFNNNSYNNNNNNLPAPLAPRPTPSGSAPPPAARNNQHFDPTAANVRPTPAPTPAPVATNNNQSNFFPSPQTVAAAPLPAPESFVATKPMSIVLTAVSAAGLTVRDINGKSDPYLTVAVIDGNGIPRANIQPQSTPYEESTLDPVWGHSMTFDGVNPGDRFEISCWDKDFLGRDEFMGSVTVTVKSLEFGPGKKSVKGDYKLRGEAPSPLPFLPIPPMEWLPTYGGIEGTLTLVFKMA